MGWTPLGNIEMGSPVLEIDSKKRRQDFQSKSQSFYNKPNTKHCFS